VFDFEPGNLLITHYIFDLLFMSIFKLHAIFVLVVFMIFSEHISAQPTYLTPSSVVNLQLKNWKSIRDEGIVKQNLDFSCGAAGLATILNQFYGQSISEQELLKALDKGDARASFADMQRALPSFGFKAQGFASTYDQLRGLKAPVLVYLKHRTTEHFSVLKGIGENAVHLADSSLGHVTLSKSQFLNMWSNHDSDIEDNLRGRFLAIVPVDYASIKVHHDYFDRNPSRKSSAALHQLAHPQF
jgi:uncharacterized protein